MSTDERITQNQSAPWIGLESVLLCIVSRTITLVVSRVTTSSSDPAIETARSSRSSSARSEYRRSLHSSDTRRTLPVESNSVTRE